MYRFLLTPRWLVAAVLTIAASAGMVFLGNWQMHRYQERTAINERIDAADATPPAPVTSVLVKPTAVGTLGQQPGDDQAWTMVTATGTYDATHEVQARGRSNSGRVGFEILTPLVLSDGTAILVDRGWVPSSNGDAVSPPVSTPPPSGPVTITGRIHLSESRPAAITHQDGRIDTRRIALPKLAEKFPYPVYGAYVLLSDPTAGYSPIPVNHEDAWQNGGYAVQWWTFAVMALLAFGWQARKEAHGDAPKKPSVDRVAEADQRVASPS
ncbi:SURF1 family protein [Actinoplanes sp. NPDC051859]|uniref:SURF1 family cytochrome oxidase biogenesis protein n=1 Tax=Actinoplanes sp. NPDC051859 TaxID=3363909 RepID=UPI00378D9FB9